MVAGEGSPVLGTDEAIQPYSTLVHVCSPIINSFSYSTGCEVKDIFTVLSPLYKE